jgi:CelD/BcsL family acetyltransferase involved in cellulose biosynthesis
LPSTPTGSAIVSTPDDLRALAPHWDRLASRFSTPLLTHDWFVSAAESFHSRDRIAVFVRKSGDDVVAIAPMLERRRFGLRSLEIIGCDQLGEPSGLLYERPSDLRCILEEIASQGLPVSIDRVSDPVLVAELSAIEGGTAGELLSSVATSPWIRIGGPWKAYYETITSKWRSAQRRAAKKAESEGAVAFDFFSPGAGEFRELMERFVEVEGRSWKSRLGTALKTNDRLRTFFERYGGASAAKGIARFAFMRIGEKPVAAQFAVEYGRRHWLLKIGYDEQYSHCSPGILLMYAALERAFDAGLEAFEFLGSNEGWIQIWDHKLHRYYSRSIDRVAPRRLLSRTIALGDRVQNKIRTRLARTGKRS